MSLRIAIVTSGRFHVCDAARELSNLGYRVAFYSCVPRFRTREFHLPDECVHSLFPILAPLFFAMRKAQGTRFRHAAECALTTCLDRLAARFIKKCDVFIGMSGMSLRSARAVRRKFGAKIWIERGSQHILAQKKILEAISQSARLGRPVANYSVRRELAEYELADTIVVPARHAEKSFAEHGIPIAKLFRNPYGVDLEMFPPTPAPGPPLTILTVGAWSLQKGSDILINAWRQIRGARLMHVGSINDVPLPFDPSFEHVGSVPQHELGRYYAKAHVFALASRQEGLALVQAQALSSGLPLVCTTRTGGEDYREWLANKNVIRVVPPEDAHALASALTDALSTCPCAGLRDQLGTARSRFSWKAYGERYGEELQRRVKN